MIISTELIFVLTLLLDFEIRTSSDDWMTYNILDDFIADALIIQNWLIRIKAMFNHYIYRLHSVVDQRNILAQR